MNDQPTPSPQASARRRLLRGAFSAPAVLTLYSGSALATKSNERCLKNQTASPAIVPTPKNSQDNWYRCQLRKEVGKNRYWLFSNDLPTERTILTFANQAQCFGANSSSNGDKDYVFNALYGPVKDTSKIGTCSKSESPLRWVALKVDDKGKVVGVGKTGGGSAISQSCWNSFKLGA